MQGFTEKMLQTIIANKHIKIYFPIEHAVKAPPSCVKCHAISVVSQDQLSVKDNPFLAWREAGLTRHKLRHLRRAFSRVRSFNEKTASVRLNVTVICAFYL